MNEELKRMDDIGPVGTVEDPIINKSGAWEFGTNIYMPKYGGTIESIPNPRKERKSTSKKAPAPEVKVPSDVLALRTNFIKEFYYVNYSPSENCLYGYDLKQFPALVTKLGSLESVLGIELPQKEPVIIDPLQDLAVNVEELASHYAEREYLLLHQGEEIDVNLLKDLTKKHIEIINQFKVINKE